MEYALHKIESESSSTPANPLMCQNGNESPSLKRSSAHISSSENQPFLSSYGSAFLSGIFADIAQASDEHQPTEAIDASVHAQTADTGSSEQCTKKARTTASTFRSQSKSYVALVGLSEGAISEVQSPTVVSPRFNMTTQKNQVLNDQVRELQDMAFPSLPQIPITVSSSSCSTTSGENSSPRPSADELEVNQDEQDSPAYGWFVSTDDDVAVPMDQSDSTASMFLPDTKPDLAFKAIAAPAEGDHDLVVQQALAADTIDDVLGDLF